DVTFKSQDGKFKIFSGGSLSKNDIKVRKVYFPISKSKIVAAYQFDIDEKFGNKMIDFIADANSGELLKEISWTLECVFGHKCEQDHQFKENHVHTSNCDEMHLENVKTSSEENEEAFIPNSYRVLPWPYEDPFDGTRELVINPELDNTTASPDGWHTVGNTNYTSTRGNNTHTYHDATGARANGGSDLEFDFPWDSAGTATNYQNASLTNLFYWNNILHDVWFNYGFDEASGNFQDNNFTGQGASNDEVNAEGFHSGTCNAFFSTPADGGNGRMEMYVCPNGQDGNFDNGVVIHEFGHGISNRLTGGPSAAGCLGNQEQMGEGWSDYFAAVMTIKADDTGATPRPIGNWLFNYGPNGGGIRPYPYSTDMNVNPMTYASSFSGVSVPHGVGSVWATMLWDLTWKLIDEYGFDPDIYNGTGGNNIAMALVVEGLKQQMCSPGFVDGRDGILAADIMLFDGAYQCLIWEAFANRGLGYSADQGSTGSRSDGTEAFDMPPSCKILMEKTVNLTDASPGQDLVYDLKAKNVTSETQSNLILTDDLPDNTFFVSASDGGTLGGSTVTWPAITLGAGDSITYQLTVQIDPNLDPNAPDFNDNMESGSGNFVVDANGSTTWNLQSGTSNSGSNAWFAVDAGSPGIADLIIANPVAIGPSSELTFTHYYDTEAAWDGGWVFISTDGGATWVNLENYFTQNGYNNTIYNSIPGFSGDSGGFITSKIDLSDFENQNVLLKFQMVCDQFVAGVGWWIDDVIISDLILNIPNTVEISNSSITSSAILAQPTKVIPQLLDLSIAGTNASCGMNDGSAIANPTGGSGDYRYLWSNGAETKVIENLAPGIYSVVVTEGVNTISDTIEIFEGGPKTITESNDIIAGSLRDIISNACDGDTLFFDQGLMNQTVSVDMGEILIDKSLAIVGL
ncbi:MAG: M36 family metallopeptidase, partial [Bacteroidota bacterium]